MLHAGRTKSMTKNITEGLAARRGKKYRGALQNTIYINTSFCEAAGFFAPWGRSAQGLLSRSFLAKRMEQFKLFGKIAQILIAILLSAADAFVTGHVLHLTDVVCGKPVHNYTCPYLPAICNLGMSAFYLFDD